MKGYKIASNKQRLFKLLSNLNKLILIDTRFEWTASNGIKTFIDKYRI